MGDRLLSADLCGLDIDRQRTGSNGVYVLAQANAQLVLRDMRVVAYLPLSAMRNGENNNRQSALI